MLPLQAYIKASATLVYRAAAITTCVAMAMGIAPRAWADADQDTALTDVAAADDGRVPSGPPATLKTRDGWTLTLS